MHGLGAPATIAELTGGVRPEQLSSGRALQLFETLYMASRNLAARTRKEYRADLIQLSDFLSKHGITKPAAVSLSHLQAFLAHLDAKGYAGVTRRRKTSSIKAFFALSLRAVSSPATQHCNWCHLSANTKSRAFSPPWNTARS